MSTGTGTARRHLLYEASGGVCDIHIAKCVHRNSAWSGEPAPKRRYAADAETTGRHLRDLMGCVVGDVYIAAAVNRDSSRAGEEAGAQRRDATELAQPAGICVTLKVFESAT